MDIVQDEKEDGIHIPCTAELSERDPSLLFYQTMKYDFWRSGA